MSGINWIDREVKGTLVASTQRIDTDSYSYLKMSIEYLFKLSLKIYLLQYIKTIHVFKTSIINYIIFIKILIIFLFSPQQFVIADGCD